MAIGTVLLKMIDERLKHAKFTKGGPEGELGSFAAAHPDVGGVTLYDDGDELTVCVDRFSHQHFGGRGPGSLEDVERAIAEDVIEFLRELFADRIVLWGSQERSGGWYLRSQTSDAPDPARPGPRYVWSGPLRSND